MAGVVEEGYGERRAPSATQGGYGSYYDAGAGGGGDGQGGQGGGGGGGGGGRGYGYSDTVSSGTESREVSYDASYCGPPSTDSRYRNSFSDMTIDQGSPQVNGTGEARRSLSSAQVHGLEDAIGPEIMYAYER